jgi:hypothetical protein
MTEARSAKGIETTDWIGFQTWNMIPSGSSGWMVHGNEFVPL